jgi:hypothetical protein
LTKDEVEALWYDIKNMVKPSWITPVPTGMTGKLKADQWRILGTTYLPSTLIRLWSERRSDDGRSVIRRQLLDTTLSLVSAIVIASSRVTSEAHAQAYLEHMKDYRSGLQVLFPKYKCHPNHHMAMHLQEYLLMFGPVHSWWTFPFERLIGVLQRTSTNYKPGTSFV